MDMSAISGMIGGMGGGGGGGGGGNWGAGLAIGGMAEQDIASFIAPGIISKKLREANKQAREQINKSYTTSDYLLGKGYQEARGDITEGRESAIGALGTGYEQAIAAQQPYAEAGMEGLATLAQLGREGGFQFGPDFDYTQDPGYQARLQEGINVIESGAAARGGLLSGGMLKAAQRYGQEFASNEYSNAYNRAYNAARDRYNTRLGLGQAMAGIGQQAAGNISGYRAAGGTGAAELYGTTGQTLGGMAYNLGTKRSSAETERGQTIADLLIDRGDINAGEWKGYGNAAMQQGQHLQQIGAGKLGSK